MVGPEREIQSPTDSPSPTDVTAIGSSAGTPSPARASGPWYRTNAPARLSPRAMAVATVTSIVALVILVGVGELLHETVLIPPLAASMALVAGGYALPLAQPRNVIGGQIVSAVTGFIVLAIAGSNPWAAAVAGGMALGAMLLLRMSHSPAAATAVIVVTSAPGLVNFLELLLLATVILVAVGAISARLNRHPYPVYWY
jgi:CBS-domain-containing membrane protein